MMHQLGRIYVVLGALAMMVAVAVDAHAYHSLKDQMDQFLWQAFRLGQEYLFVHGVAVVVAGVMAHYSPKPLFALLAGGCFLLGGLFFTGNIYALIMTDWRLPIPTPIGGFFILGGWLAMALAGWVGLPPRPPQR